MANASDIKSEIETLLNDLVNSGDLADVQVDDFSTDIMNRNFHGYPTAILTTPEVESAVDTNASNMRTYTYGVVVVMKWESIQSSTDVEDLVETILDKFDDNVTLNGKADGGVSPSTTRPSINTDRGQTWVVFGVEISARATESVNIF